MVDIAELSVCQATDLILELGQPWWSSCPDEIPGFSGDEGRVMQVHGQYSVSILFFGPALFAQPGRWGERWGERWERVLHSLSVVRSLHGKMSTYPHRQSIYEIYNGEEYVSMLPPMTSEEDLLQDDFMNSPGSSPISPSGRRLESYDLDRRGRKQNPVLRVVSLLVQNVRRHLRKLGGSWKGTRTS
ncbi:hypothetical protein SCP_1702180 [Sparassis crispa]|uniref:Uncharacterized protein n=1 Tax=Sparassis crispa TaxID=139825 RepID=A0A401H658_9APHY|nr:hypothetical protein SCP_1702180 [Sparassis crispa]GBE89892.1 hypothetical protein SCP_1702180 [Sparassis crispa]